MAYREPEYPEEYFEGKTEHMDGRILFMMKKILMPAWRLLILPVLALAWILWIPSIFLVPIVAVFGFVVFGKWGKFVDFQQGPFLYNPDHITNFYEFLMGEDDE